MKKLVFFLLAIVSLICLFAFCASAYTGTRLGTTDIYYQISNGEVTITDASVSITTAEIPSTIEGCPVTKIGNRVFEYCSGLTSITIPDSVTSIGDYAFYGCSGLTSITIPDSVTSIGNGAFYGCNGLKSIKIPSSVKSIGESAFEDCTGLTSITIPDSVTSIGSDAFSYCTGLTSITIPDSITSIGDYAFYGTAYYNNSWNWEDGLLYIDNHLIKAKTDITSVALKPGTKVISNSAFEYCTGLTSITIPDSVTSIGSSAFSGCSGLTSITIPDSITSIGNGAFYGCTGLTSITIPNSVTSIGGYVFYDCSGLTSITLPFVGDKPHKSTDTYQYPFGYIFGTSYTGDTLQYYYGSSTSSTTHDYYYIPSSLKTVKITGSSYIPYGAFYNCSNITSITIPDSVTSIGDYAFYGCTGLTSITIPDSVTSIGDYAFYGCTGLTSVNISDLEAWCKISFQNLYANPLYYAHKLYLNGELVTDLVIPDSVTSIGDYAFDGCTGLTSITIPDSVTSIGDRAFYECIELTSITIPDSVTKIGSLVISGEQLNKIIFKGNAPKFSETTFGDAPEFLIDYVKKTYPDIQVCKVLYPYKAEGWKSAIKSTYGGIINWAVYSKGTLQKLELISAPTKTYYNIGDKLNYKGLTFKATWSDGLVETITDSTVQSEDLKYSKTVADKAGTDSVKVSYHDKSISFKFNVHELKDVTVSTVNYPESTHNYKENISETKSLVYPEALKYNITFSSKTFVEKDGDYIYVNGKEYTGSELSGKTVTVNSNKITIKLTSDGYDNYYGYSIDKITATVPVHVEQIIPAVEPTCTTVGKTEGKHCSVCNKVLEAQDTIPATGHKQETIPAQEPTCEEEGLTEGKKCSVCGEMIVAQERKSALGHLKVITDEAVPATCTTAGKTEGKHCAVCKKVLVPQEIIPALGHTEKVIPAVPATCKATGLSAGKKCSVCGKVLEAQVETPIDESNHNKVLDPTSITEPTCTEAGSMQYNCTICGIKVPVVIQALGHQYQPVPGTGNSPTCVNSGKEPDKKCALCKSKVEGETIPATGHSEEIIPAVAATCKATGLTEGKKCSVCNKIIVPQQAVAKVSHTYGSYKVTTAATCIKEGVKTKTCTVCGAKKTASVPKIDHKYGDYVVTTKATCTKTGVKTATCSVCKATKTATVAITAHKYGSYKTTTKATCTKAGAKTATCSVCGVKKTATINATGHKYGSYKVSTKATCTKAGKKTATCSVCKAKKTESIKATGHTYGSYKVSTKATCTKAGKKTATCSVCKAKKTASIKATGHTYKTTVTKATLSKDGKITKTCSVCKATTSTVISKIKTVTLAKTSYTYTGKAIKPAVTVKDSKGKVVSSSNYTVKYSSNTNPGTAKVTITFNGNYSDTKSLTFKINLGKVSFTTANMDKSYKVTLKWNAVEGAKTYKVQVKSDLYDYSWMDWTTISKTEVSSTFTGWEEVEFRVIAIDANGKESDPSDSVKLVHN